LVIEKRSYLVPAGVALVMIGANEARQKSAPFTSIEDLREACA